MATYTPNYNLEKPDATDNFGDFRASYNSNMDIIDANLGGGGGGGDTVSWTQIQATGEKIAEITINGTTTDVLIPFEAKIIVTTTTGLTVTASKGGTTYTATETSTGVYEVTVDSKGTWTVTDGTNTTTVSVTAQTTYNVAFVVIPDGSTVTPTDDIQTWLNCANIWDKAYTTLAEVLADSTTLSALISDNNATDYLVRSTSWIGNVAVVPTMTDNTHPYGRAVTLTNLADAYKAFDNDLSTGPSHDGTVSKEGYIFDTPVKLSKWGNYANVNPSNTNENRFSIEYTDDGVTWTSLPTEYHRANAALTWEYFTIADEVSEHLGWWIVHHDLSSREIQFFNSGITTSEIAMTYIGLNNYCANKLLADSTWRSAICNSAYFESVLNVKVPPMTDNTHPSGECSGSSVYSTGDYYKAFDGNTNDGWLSSGIANQYVGYDFGSAKNICMTIFNNYGFDAPTSVRVKNFKIQGSNTSMIADMSDLNSGQYPNTTNYVQKCIFTPTSKRYYRVFVDDPWSTGYYIGLKDVQFYGREDV